MDITHSAGVEPWARLALAMLERAKLDAQRGDLAALAWLVVVGRDIADVITDGGGWGVLRFCRGVAEQHDAATLASFWHI